MMDRSGAAQSGTASASAEGVLRGKIVLITGSGRGIGAAMARLAAEHGATVIVNDVDAEAASALDIRRRGGTAVPMAADVADWDAADALVTGIVERFGRLDGLVNNAGLFSMAPAAESSPRTWDALVRTNIIGVAACGQRAIAQMLGQGFGSIVNVTSGAQCGSPLMSVYGATKAAVASLTYTWAMELQDSHVRVNAISPRGDTRMSRYAKEFRSRRGEAVTSEPAAAVNAPTAIYLLSDVAAGITGQVVRVEGGAIGLMLHPAVAAPMIDGVAGDVALVARAFDEQFRHRLVPTGVAGVSVGLSMRLGEPGWAAPLAPVTPG
jgi:NAD(P)-dependent dehydrogenase (short-subunit alcohol dehydrogenase family)